MSQVKAPWTFSHGIPACIAPVPYAIMKLSCEISEHVANSECIGRGRDIKWKATSRGTKNQLCAPSWHRLEYVRRVASAHLSGVVLVTLDTRRQSDVARVCARIVAVCGSVGSLTSRTRQRCTCSCSEEERTTPHLAVIITASWEH